MRMKVYDEYSHRHSPIKSDSAVPGRRFPPAEVLRSQTSISSVTGPSLTSSTSIAAPNWPRWAPRSSQARS